MSPRLLRTLGALALGTLGVATMLGGAGIAGAAQPPVGLGAASSFTVLAGSTVTNTGPTSIDGDVGVSPGSAIVGLGLPATVGGTFHAADALAAQAQLDVTTAYDDAAGRNPITSVPTELGGSTLVPGVYSGATLGITGALTLDAQGDPAAVFVFQSASTLITASASSVVLLNNANPCNVYWQVSSSATLGTGSSFVGTVLALTSISAETGATINGRLFARNAAVTLDSNVFTSLGCAALPVTPTTTTTAAAPTTTIDASATTAPGGGGATTAPGGGGATTAPGAVTVPTDVSGSTVPVLTTPPVITLPTTGSGSKRTAGMALLTVVAGAVVVRAVRRKPSVR